LRVTTCNHDLRQRVFAVDTADGSAGVLVGGGGNRASIQDDNLRFASGGGPPQATFFELPLDRSAIRLGGTTPKILYVIGRHRTIVAALFVSVRLSRSFVTWDRRKEKLASSSK